MSEWLAASVAAAARGVGGVDVAAGPGTAGVVALALQQAPGLADRVLVDAAVAAERLANVAGYWQAGLVSALVDRREQEALLELLAARAASPAGVASGFGDITDPAFLQLEEDEAQDLARRAAVAEVAAVGGVSESRVAQNLDLVQSAWAWHPEVADAVRTGRVDLARARVITQGSGVVGDDAARAAVDGQAVEAAVHGATTAALRRLVQRLVAQYAPVDQGVATQSMHAVQTGGRFRSVGYGLTAMTVTASAALMLQVQDAVAVLTRMGTTPPDDDTSGGQGGHGGVNPAEAVTDLLLTVTEGDHPFTTAAGRPGGRAPVAINLTVPLSTLFGGGVPQPQPPFNADADPGAEADVKGVDEPGELTGHGWLPAGLVREIVAEYGARATWRCHYVDDRPESPHWGSIIGVGRAAHDPTYAPSLTTRAYLAARDRVCRFPGCQRDAARCDLDHVTPHAAGGPTCDSNLISLCRHHHRLKHRGGFTPATDSDDVIWTTPTGHQVRVTPRHVLADQQRLRAERARLAALEPPPY